VLEDAAFEIEAHPRPIIEVLPFQPLIAGVVVTEGKIDHLRERFEAAVRQKVGWYGGSILRFAYVADTVDEVTAAMREMLDEGATILLSAGGHMMDPLDATQGAIDLLGARIVRHGAPAHPGSMFWLGHLERGDVPIVSLASCSMYSRATVADLILPRLFVGERPTSNDLAALGHGGLLDRDMGWRFPAYDVEAVDEPDEAE
jgi:molybdopterin biosynthesis enzyme